MRILIITMDQIPHVGGKSTHILDLMDGFRSIGIVTDLLSQRSIDNFWLLLYKIVLAPFWIINRDIFIFLYKKLLTRQIYRRTIQYCEKFHPDIISVQDAWTGYALRKVKEKFHIPIIMTMHTYFGLENTLDKHPSRLTTGVNEINRSLEEKSLIIVDAVIAVDKRIEKHIKETIQRIGLSSSLMNRITSIMNFTNIDKFQPLDSTNKNLLREKLGFSPDSFIVSCTRRLVEKNGVIFAVEALSQIMDSNYIFLIGGDGPQYENIKQYISVNRLSKTIRLLGPLDHKDTLQLYQISDVSLVPSISVNGLQEATSISALEAMACGIPIIASNIGGLKQIIVNEETGILVDERNSTLIRDAIVRLKNDKFLYENIRINSRRYVVENHSHIQAAKDYLSSYTRTKDILSTDS